MGENLVQFLQTNAQRGEFVCKINSDGKDIFQCEITLTLYFSYQITGEKLL